MNILNLREFSGDQMVWVILLLVWTLFWKGFALWTAAHRSERGWFIALLILNTAGILEIVYLFGFAKKQWSDVTALFARKSSATDSSPKQ